MIMLNKFLDMFCKIAFSKFVNGLFVGDGKLVDNFSHESDVMSLQDLITFFLSWGFKTQPNHRTKRMTLHVTSLKDPFLFYYWVPDK